MNLLILSLLTLLSTSNSYAQNHDPEERISLQTIMDTAEEIEDELETHAIINSVLAAGSYAAEIRTTATAMATSDLVLAEIMAGKEVISISTFTAARRGIIALFFTVATRVYGPIAAGLTGWVIGRAIDRNFPGGVPLSELISSGLCNLTDCNGFQELGIETTNIRGFHP